MEAVRLRRHNALELAHAELEACQNQACPRRRELSLLVGFLALSEGDAARAKDRLLATPAPPALEAFHTYYLGEAQFYLRDFTNAAASFEKAQKIAPEWMQRDLLARQGEALLAAGAPERAAPLLETAANALGTPELYFQRAAARRGVGNVDGQIADLKAVALRFPGHAYAALSLEQLRKLRPKTLHFSFDERLTRAKGLLDSDPEATLAELTTIVAEKLAKGGSAKARMAYLRAQAYFAQGKKDEALAQIETARGGQASIAADATLLKARALLRVDDHAAAKALLQEIDRRWPKEGAGDDAGYLLGWIDLQDGKFDEAVTAFAAFEKKHPRSSRRDEALWFRALTEVRRNQLSNARAALTLLLKQYPRSGLVPQARYWVARCAQIEASTALASQGYRELISLFPGSFYSVLAAERLRELNEQPPAGFPAPPKLLKAETLPALALAHALAQAGLFKDAGDEVSWQIAHVRNQADALKFGHALSALSEFGAAHALASRQLWGAAFGSKNPEALALFYPRAYAESVEAESKARSLDPFLVWAIMRRESAFRAEVMSGANARGLMQLIPPTATAIAKELQLPAPDPDELFSPELNIKMGAWYLAKLLERFQHPALVAAAYNAGPSAAVRWVKEKGDLPLDLFVEVIPFKETRGYVKQVVADYLTYHTFYDGKPPRVALAIPTPSEAGVTF